MKISNLTQNLIIFSAFIVTGALVINKYYNGIKEDISKNF
jgi:hypothetical protein